MSKINDNTYINKIKKEIIAGTFKNKENLINFLKKNRFEIINDSFFRQELEDSFIKLNEETMANIEKLLLEFYDKRQQKNINSLNLDGVSGFQIDDKDYIKVESKDYGTIVFDDSMSNDSFVKQFQDRQNSLSSTSLTDANKNKEEIVKDMKEEKIEADLKESQDVIIRDLTDEEKKQFAAVMNMPNSADMRFLIDPSKNMYINKDNGDIYFVKKNKSGELEVRKAEEKTTNTIIDDVKTISDDKNEVTIQLESIEETKYDSLSDSDLEYIYVNKNAELTADDRKKIFEEIKRRKKFEQQDIGFKNTNNKVFVKKIDNALHKPYNGFISLIFLCSIVGFFGLGFLSLIIVNLS